MNYFFEPYLFAIDPQNITQTEFEDYIHNLIDWDNLLKMDMGQSYILSSTLDCLHKNGLYPFIDNLKKLLKQYNLHHIGANDVGRILNMFLTKLPNIEDNLSIIFDHKKTTTDINYKNRPNVFNNNLQTLVGLVSLRSKINKEKNETNIILTRDIRGKHTFASHFDIMNQNNTVEETIIKSEFYLFDTLNSYFKESTTPITLCRYAECTEIFDLGIRIYLFQKCKYDQLSEVEKKHKYVIQNSFIKSLIDLNVHSSDSKLNATLRTLYDIILNQNLDETHWIRRSRGANAPQVNFENFNAWRKDIDNELHLHYWKNNMLIYFADVVTHNTIKITNEFKASVKISS